MIHGLGDPDAFLATRHRTGERRLLSEGTGEAVTRKHRGKASQAKALMDQIAFEQLDIPGEKRYRLTIVAQGKEGLAQAEVRLHLQGEIAEALINGKGTLARLNRLLLVPHPPKVVTHVYGYPPQPTMIIKSLSESFGGV